MEAQNHQHLEGLMLLTVLLGCGFNFLANFLGSRKGAHDRQLLLDWSILDSVTTTPRPSRARTRKVGRLPIPTRLQSSGSSHANSFSGPLHYI